MIEILEYQNASKIELGIDDKEIEIIGNKLHELLNDEDREVFHIFEILADHGIVIR